MMLNKKMHLMELLLEFLVQVVKVVLLDQDFIFNQKYMMNF
jgi:hypothetical protein